MFSDKLILMVENVTNFKAAKDNKQLYHLFYKESNITFFPDKHFKFFFHCCSVFF